MAPAGCRRAAAIEPEERGDSKLLGYLPVGWYPAALCFDAERNRLAVANVKGLGPGRPRKGGSKAPEFNSHQYHGSLSLVPLPQDDAELARLSLQVDVNVRREAIEYALLPPRPDQPPRAIPERIGEPSRIRHVVYVIKENRTYDQPPWRCPVPCCTSRWSRSSSVPAAPSLR